MRVFHFISHFDMGGAEKVAASIAKSGSEDMEYHLVETMRTFCIYATFYSGDDRCGSDMP